LPATSIAGSHKKPRPRRVREARGSGRNAPHYKKVRLRRVREARGSGRNAPHRSRAKRTASAAGSVLSWCVAFGFASLHAPYRMPRPYGMVS